MSNTFTRDGLIALLKNDVLTVTFTKNNGSERTMRCTLQADLLPAIVVAEGVAKKEKKVNEAVVPAYDLEAKAFRSFRVDSIKKVIRK